MYNEQSQGNKKKNKPNLSVDKHAVWAGCFSFYDENNHYRHFSNICHNNMKPMEELRQSLGEEERMQPDSEAEAKSFVYL